MAVAMLFIGTVLFVVGISAGPWGGDWLQWTGVLMIASVVAGFVSGVKEERRRWYWRCGRER